MNFVTQTYLYNREEQRLKGKISIVSSQQDDSLMQNQIPTADLQALVPEFAARGQ